MTEDTMLLARLRATASVRGLHSLSSARASPLPLAAEDAGRLRPRNGKDWLALAQEEDMMTSLRLATVAHHAVDSLLAESAHLWLVV